MLHNVKLNSSAIRSASYDTDTHILTIEFKNERKYDYPGVPEMHFHALLKAESAGKYFNQFIKPYGG